MHSFFRSLLASALLALVVLAAGGCGGAGEKLYPVSGRATLKGEPLKAGVVTFVPDEARGTRLRSNPSGMVGPDGTYTLSYEGRPGAPPGWYRVTVNTETPGMGGGAAVHTDPSRPAPLGGAGGGVRADPRYKDPAKTDLKVEVVAGPPAGAYDLKLLR